MAYSNIKLKNVLFNPRVCTICLDNCEELGNLEADIEITIMNYKCSCNLKLVLEELFGNNVEQTTEYICAPCKEKSIDFFIFKHEVLRNVEIYEHLVSQLDKKTNELLDFCNTEQNILGNMLIVLEKHPEYFKKFENTSLDKTLSVKTKSELEKEQSIKVESKTVSLRNLSPVKKCYVKTKSELGKENLVKVEGKTVPLNNIKKEMICDCCNNEFYTKQGLINHLNYPNRIPYQRARDYKDQRLLCCSSQTCPHVRYMKSIRAQKDANESHLKCIDCDFASKTFSGIMSHINKEHLHIEYECKTCGLMLPSWYKLNFHRRTCNKSRCPTCLQAFKPDALQEHWESCGKTVRPFRCDFCPASFKVKARLTLHLKSHLKTFKCDICGHCFLNAYNLRRHKLRSHKSEFNYNEHLHSCTVCYEKCDSLRNLQQHLTTHHEYEKHVCRMCDIEFDTLSEYKAHIRRITHKKVEEGYKKRTIDPRADMLLTRYTKCSICGIKCSSYTKLHQHLRSHGPHERHKCETCDLEVSSRITYLRHITTRGHLEKCYPNHQNLILRCDSCKYCTTSEGRMRRHKIRQHLHPKDVNVYACQFCNKTFKLRFLYKSHITRHISNQNNLQRIQNTGPRVCDICGKTLNSGVAMIKHRRLHTGERPYPCDMCDLAFISSSQRTSHVLRLHSEKTVKCPVCYKMFHTVCNARCHVRKTHWKSKEPFDFTKLPGDQQALNDLFKDRRLLE